MLPTCAAIGTRAAGNGETAAPDAEIDVWRGGLNRNYS